MYRGLSHEKKVKLAGEGQKVLTPACGKVALYPRFTLSFCHLQGNLFDFLRLTGWRGSKVLYFGDHLYSDLAVSEMSLLSTEVGAVPHGCCGCR